MSRLFDNLALKAASLGLAVLLWVVIAGEKTSEMGLSVPVELQNFPKDMELTGEPVNAVEVRLRASPGVMQQLGTGEIAAQVDLNGMGEGERIIHLTESAIRVPFGVKVVKITPAILSLHLERTLQKVVPIRPRLIGRPAPGFEVAEVSAAPAEVRVAGPKSRVQEVESAFTEPVSLDGAGRNVVERVNIGLEDPVLRIQGSPQVQVTARVRDVIETRALSLPVEPRAAGFSARPAVVRVLLKGPAALLKRLGTEDARAFAAPPADGSGRAAVRVELGRAFAALSVESLEPAEVVLRPARK